MTGALPLSGEPSGEYGGGASPSINKGGADGKSGMEREHERGCKVAAADRESEEKRKGLAVLQLKMTIKYRTRASFLIYCFLSNIINPLLHALSMQSKKKKKKD